MPAHRMVMLLGIIAVNHGGKLDWDSKNMKITNRPELNQYLKAPVRKGWEYGENLVDKLNRKRALCFLVWLGLPAPAGFLLPTAFDKMLSPVHLCLESHRDTN